jgi:hypothetical protein
MLSIGSVWNASATGCIGSRTNVTLAHQTIRNLGDYIMLIVAVVHEIWPHPTTPTSKPIRIRGTVDAGDGYEDARSLAEGRAKVFDHHGYHEEDDYWWGFSDNVPTECHRFLVRTPPSRPAASIADDALRASAPSELQEEIGVKY